MAFLDSVNKFLTGDQSNQINGVTPLEDMSFLEKLALGLGGGGAVERHQDRFQEAKKQNELAALASNPELTNNPEALLTAAAGADPSFLAPLINFKVAEPNRKIQNQLAELELESALNPSKEFSIQNVDGAVVAIDKADPTNAQVVFSDPSGRVPKTTGLPDGYMWQNGAAVPIEGLGELVSPADPEAEGKLRKEFNGLDTDFRLVRDAHKKVRAASPTPTGDIALVFAFMKMVDPTTGVKEGEFATARDAQNIPDKIVTQYNRLVKTGESLSPALRAGYRRESDKIFNAQASTHNSTAEEYRTLASEYGFKPDRIAKVVSLVDVEGGGADIGLSEGGSPPPSNGGRTRVKLGDME